LLFSREPLVGAKRQGLCVHSSFRSRLSENRLIKVGRNGWQRYMSDPCHIGRSWGHFYAESGWYRGEIRPFCSSAKGFLFLWGIL